MPLLALILGSVLFDPPGPIHILWRFNPGQDFFVEETHRQLLTVTSGGDPVSTYIDYSAILHYQVKRYGRDHVMMDATVERVRVNNPNEAGAKAVAAIKQREKARTTWHLTRTEQGWHAVADARTPDPYPPIFLTLGTRRGADARSWQQSWSVPLPTGTATLRLNARLKQPDQFLRVELRPEWVTADNIQSVTLRSLPSDTVGIALYDRAQGRWYYADFRLKSIARTTQGDKTIEIKQDYMSYYRYFDRLPPWRD